MWPLVRVALVVCSSISSRDPQTRHTEARNTQTYHTLNFCILCTHDCGCVCALHCLSVLLQSIFKFMAFYLCLCFSAFDCCFFLCAYREPPHLCIAIEIGIVIMIVSVSVINLQVFRNQALHKLPMHC